VKIDQEMRPWECS